MLPATWTATCPAISNRSVLSYAEPEQEFMLAKSWKDKGDVDAAHQLGQATCGLGEDRHGYRGYGLPVADLISEGNLGMMHAVKSNPTRASASPPTPCGGSRRRSRNTSSVMVACEDRHHAGQKKLFFNLRCTGRSRPSTRAI